MKSQSNSPKQKPDSHPAGRVPTSIPNSQANAAIDTIEQNMRAKFQ